MARVVRLADNPPQREFKEHFDFYLLDDEFTPSILKWLATTPSVVPLSFPVYILRRPLLPVPCFPLTLQTLSSPWLP